MSLYNARRIDYVDGYKIIIFDKQVEYDKPIKEKSDNHDIFHGNHRQWLLEHPESREAVLKREHSNYSSRSRSKQNIYDISRSNSWDWFGTLTYDRCNIDSSDFDAVSRVTSQWLKNVKKRYAPSLKYLLVPELHSDKEHWHFHCLLANCGNLHFDDTGVIKNGTRIYDIREYKLGFCNASRVVDNGRVTNYICKYITKDLCEQTKGKKRFWYSRNCNKGQYTDFNLEDIRGVRADLARNADYSKTIETPRGRITYLEFNNRGKNK